MFRIAVFFAVLGIVTAFVPAGRIVTSSSVSMQFEDALGAQPPLGFWDPLGLLKDADEERFGELSKFLCLFFMCY